MATNVQFIQSCEGFLEYPKNLVQHDALSHNIEAYYERLNIHSKRLFHENQAAVDFLDLDDGAAAFRSTRIPNLRELRLHLREALNPGQSDPQCRFIFVYAPNSRAPLRITQHMLMFLFSYHQIIPCFLDFVFPFGKQVYAQDSYFSGFREESRITTQINGIPDLRRSGLDLRICYNLRSVEKSTEQPDLPWSIRQSAVYHEFDIETGRTLWVVVKGNKVIKERIAEASGRSSLYDVSTRSEAFAASLIPHLVLCDWSGENWRWYINALEDELQNHTRDVLSTRIDRPASVQSSPVAAEEPKSPFSRSSSFPLLSRAGTSQTTRSQRVATGQFSTRTDSGFSRYNIQSSVPTFVNDQVTSRAAAGTDVQHENEKYSFTQCPRTTMTSVLRRANSSIFGPDHCTPGAPHDLLVSSIEMKSSPLSHNGKPLPQELPPAFPDKDKNGLNETHTFSDLQKIQYFEEKAQEALLVLRQNAEVLEELKQYYSYATDHPAFPSELKIACEPQIARFKRCVLSVEKDLKMLQSRTETLVHLLGNRKNLLNGILQYRSAKASESSAKRAEATTNYMAKLTQDMHEIAQKTKRETVSMRVITSVTLFFLPATFLATFMSTNIMDFEGGKQNFHVNGLKVYLAVALPLTALTFFAWYVIYRLAGKIGWSNDQAEANKHGSNV